MIKLVQNIYTEQLLPGILCDKIKCDFIEKNYPNCQHFDNLFDVKAFLSSSQRSKLETQT